MLQWINDLIYFLGSFFPHIYIVRSTHAGVRFRFGKPHKIEPGRVIIYWPIVTELKIIPIIEQTTETAPIVVLTKDSKQVAVCAVIIYSINDAFTAVVKPLNVYSIIDNVVQSALADLISVMTLEEIQSDIHGFNDILSEITSEELSKFGVQVEDISIIGLSKCFTLRNIGDTWSVSPGKHLDIDTGENL